jgi:glycosyltransferase involved in cell wall biosynthesis
MHEATNPRISVIVTTHNEGSELAHTLRSISENTRQLYEIIVVDDGSDDGSCDSIDSDRVRVIRHPQRIGIAFSRHEGSLAALGDVLCYLDAHQRVSPDCLDRCAQLAMREHAVTCPDIRDFGLFHWRLHGANFELCPARGYFSARWRQRFVVRSVSQVSALRAPPYLIPRSLYDRVAWSPRLRGWGASEACVGVKAYFTGIRILHMSRPLALHRFQRDSHYAISWSDMYRNQAIIARICFDDDSWRRYWLPRVFERHLTEANRVILDSAEIQIEHEEFQRIKVHSDRQFWTDLGGSPLTANVNRSTRLQPAERQ